MRKNRNNYLGLAWTRIVVCLFALSCTSTALVAQQQDPDQAPPSTDSQDVKPVVLQLPSYSQSVALLGTDQRFLDLETLQARRRTFFIYGMGISEAYEDNSGAVAGQEDYTEAIWSPHVAIISASNHSSFSIQYAPSIIQATSGSSGHQVFQAGSISFVQPISPNWLMQLGSSNTYGTDAVRLLSPLAFGVSNGVPVADPSSALFQLNSGQTFSTTNLVGMTWQHTASQVLNFSLGESSLLTEGGPDNSSIFGRASYSAAVTSRTALDFEGNYYYRLLTESSCADYGFTVGISHQISRYVNISFGAGPEFKTSPCTSGGLGGNYNLNVAFPLSRVSRLGLTAQRIFTTTYLLNAQYSDTASVTYFRRLSEAFGVTLNSGYARTVRAQITPGTIIGYFVQADLSWKLSRSISLATTYKRFEQVSGGPDQSQNVAQISLGWNPLPTRIVK